MDSIISMRMYRGRGIDRDVAETKTANRISKKRLAAEPALYKTKWFDYRLLHHGEATCLFAAFFIETSRIVYAKYFDKDMARQVQPIRKTIFDLSRAEAGGVWVARQKADEYGMPYGFFCMRGLEFALSKTSWRMMPRPGQLANEETIKGVLEQWPDFYMARLIVAENPFFRIDNFTGHPDQVAHQEWLISNAMLRPNPAYTLSGVIGKTLQRERAEEVFGRDVVQHACEISRQK